MPVTSENGLWIFIPVMTALALAGLVLAARVEEGMFHYAGFALLVVSVLLIFAGLKGYYDAKERQQHQH
ncbi:MAG TPA: hypothetical protein VKB68_11625 [Stellaceae bacterium]|nr:hypothetical protein [Stellaceae bacterium]